MIIKYRSNEKVKRYVIEDYYDLVENVIWVFDFELKSKEDYDDFKRTAIRYKNNPESRIFYGIVLDKYHKNSPIVPLTEEILSIYKKNVESFEKDWDYYQLKQGLVLDMFAADAEGKEIL